MNKAEAFRRGKAGEAAVRIWLESRGYFVVRTADISGGAPMMASGRAKVILPDLMASVRGQSNWVEVKTKSEATFYRATKTHEHGLHLENWNAYRECEQQTGIPGWLCIYELKGDMILLQKMAVLQGHARVYSGTNMPDGQPHVFFPRNHFVWHNGPDWGDAAFSHVPRLTPLPPLAPRTQTQPPAPRERQLSLMDDE